LAHDSPSPPLVSVIALCYNHARFAVECLNSILAQTYPNIELIIMDDASTDASVAVIRGWILSRAVPCTFVAHRDNAGTCRTLNEALSHARGTYVSIVSTDDVWQPDKLQQQVPLMEAASEDVGVLYSDAWRMSEIGTRLPGMFIESHRRFPAMPTGNIFPVLFEGNFIPAMTTLVRRSCYATVGTYDERLSYEDWDMWLRIARSYTFIFSPFVSASYRMVSNSLARTLRHPSNAALRISDFLIALKYVGQFEDDPPRHRIAAAMLVEAADDLYRLDHPEMFSCLRVALQHAPVLWGSARLRVYLLWACSRMGLPYRAFDRLDRWMTRMRRTLLPER
jgi:glycosyltransferase involved in cell wall biosynthesis